MKRLAILLSLISLTGCAGVIRTRQLTSTAGDVEGVIFYEPTYVQLRYEFRALTDGRQHPRRVKDFRNCPAQPETLQTGLGQDERVEAFLCQFAQARLDVATNIYDLQIRPAMQQLGPPAQAACSHNGTCWQTVQAGIALGDEHIAGGAARRHGRQDKAHHGNSW